MTQYFCTSLLLQGYSNPLTESMDFSVVISPQAFSWQTCSFLLFLQWEEAFTYANGGTHAGDPQDSASSQSYLQRYKSSTCWPSLFMKLLAVSMFIWMLTLAKSMQNVNAQLFKGGGVEAQGRQTVEFGFAF